jgi:hypothetical protein
MEFTELTALAKLSKDVKTASATLTDTEARFLVDTYYQLQAGRIRSTNQIRAIDKAAGKDGAEPHETISFFAKNYKTLESNIRACLAEYVEAKPIARWMMSIVGIGPVLAARLIANIDIKRVETAGQIHAFAGLDPTKKWMKGEKRPWNPRLKTLCWKIGQSFIKMSGRDDAVYGKVYLLRKQYETKKNENLEYRDQCKAILATKHFKNKEMQQCYESGKLPPSHITQRAARYATKLFLSHLFTVWYELDRHEKPPKPYPIGIMNHAHEIYPPNWKDGKIVLPKETAEA